MKKLSMIIPNRNSPFLTKTIESILENAVEDIEVLVNVDEAPPDREVKDSRVKYFYPTRTIGMRGGINFCAHQAEGHFICKCDDHVLFGPGFDRILKEAEDDWVVIPRRYSLDAENWTIENNPKGPRDYHYLCYPQKGKHHDDGIHGVEWPQRTRERTGPEYAIDDTMSMQGSCWFVSRTYFLNFMEGMSEVGYGQFAQEAQEIGLKCVLSGGRLVVNKNTWYAHLHKGHRYGRMYHLDETQNVAGINWSAEFWMNNRWPKQTRTLQSFIEQYWPVPTWPDDRSLWVSPSNQT